MWKYRNDYATTSRLKLSILVADTHLSKRMCHAELFVSQSGEVFNQTTIQWCLVNCNNHQIARSHLLTFSQCDALLERSWLPKLYLSVHPSVCQCHTPALWQNSADTIFSYPNSGWCATFPFHPKFRLKLTLPSENTYFNRFPLVVPQQ